MKISSLFVALCIFLGFLVIVGSARGLLNGYNTVPAQISQRGLNPSPTGRKALSVGKESETVLVAAVDGTVYLLDYDSLKPLWSFASGSEIYSSYQAPVAVGNDNDDNEPATGLESAYYIDCGDDWELYAHSRLGKVKLMKSLEEYVSSTPQIGEDGGIVLGSKQTRAFMVDGKTGRLINTYQMPNSSYSTQYVYQDDAHRNSILSGPGEPTPIEVTADVLPLYFTRTDYTLTSFAPNSNKVLWNLTVAEIAAASLCQDGEDSLDGAIIDSGSSGAGFNMPLPCQSRALIYRSQNEDISEALSGSNQLTKANHPGMMLPAPAPHDSLPRQPKINKLLQIIPSIRNVDIEADSRGSNFPKSLPSVTEDAEIYQAQKSKMPSIDGLSGITVIFTAIVGGMVAYFYPSFGKTNGWVQLFSYKSPDTLPLRKKKPRKSGKNGNNAEKRDKEVLLDGTSNNSLLDGRKIGKLFVSNKEIAKGSNGTVVLEGTYERRDVAVKRLVKTHHEVAFKEIQNLIASDRHPNIVRYYGEVQDQDFVYLSLERCVCNLNDLIHLNLGFQNNLNHDTVNLTQNKTQLDSVSDYLQTHSLSRKNGYPSHTLLKVMRNVVAGLVHLHELGIIHRDLKPQNILITLEKTPSEKTPSEKTLCAKLSDMGISKCLVGDMSSLTHHGTGNGSSGWQAPEQLRNDRQTRAVDLFSLGCVLFYCMTDGKHPFGNHLERDFNILKNKVDLFLVENIPEALNLFSHLLNPSPELRPKAVDVLAHPLFWSSEKRLNFLKVASDRVENEDRKACSDLLKALESTAPMALGGKWNEKMDQAFIDNMGRHRRYNYESVRDLLRVIRNKSNHYSELPKEIQGILGPVPEGYEGYFSSRFPRLLMEVYKVLRVFCKEEKEFEKFFHLQPSS